MGQCQQWDLHCSVFFYKRAHEYPVRDRRPGSNDLELDFRWVCAVSCARKVILAPGIDGSRFLPVLGNSIRNWWSRTLCNLTRGGPLIRFICGVTSENLMVHYFSLMLELKFTEFVILKNKYNCKCYISGLYLCSGVICEVSWFRNRSAAFSNVNKWK